MAPAHIDLVARLVCRAVSSVRNSLTRPLTGRVTGPIADRPTHASPQGGGDGRVAYGDQQAYAAGGYTAFASPWSTYGGGANAGLARPADYQDTMRIRAATFPDDTRIETRWPSPGPGTVTGYYFVAKGDYDGSDPTGWTPWQVGNITAFTETFSLSMAAVSAAADYIILNEFYLCTGPNSSDKKYEIAHWYHATGVALAFFNAGTLIGEHTDGSGRVWEVRNTGNNPLGAPYLVFLLKSRADLLAATIDKKAALLWLVAQGLALNHLYVNGTAIGLETYRGVNVMEVADYDVSFSGSGSVIPAPPTNLITNGDFSGGDTGWTGFYYSGKYPASGKGNFNNAGGWGTTSPYDGFAQTIAGGLTAAKYYELTYTVGRTSGTTRPRLVGGASAIRYGLERSASGTFTERLLVNTGNTQLEFIPSDANFQGTIDDVILTGPYTTSTVGGA